MRRRTLTEIEGRHFVRIFSEYADAKRREHGTYWTNQYEIASCFIQEIRLSFVRTAPLNGSHNRSISDSGWDEERLSALWSWWKLDANTGYWFAIRLMCLSPAALVQQFKRWRKRVEALEKDELGTIDTE